jgi:hypothetical protein
MLLVTSAPALSVAEASLVATSTEPLPLTEPFAAFFTAEVALCTELATFDPTEEAAELVTFCALLTEFATCIFRVLAVCDVTFCT